MRLDWFLPALRRSTDGEPVRPSLLRKFSCSLLPRAAFSDHRSKRRGAMRRLLRRLGPSWLYSPVRRICQTVCFIGFLWLLFYVCWPYTARPETRGEESHNWRFVDVDQDQGAFVLNRQDPETWALQTDRSVHVVDTSAMDTDTGYLGEFRVIDIGHGEIQILSPNGPSPELMDHFLLGSGPWSLYERQPNKWPSHYADDLERKESISAELFLVIDPLVSLSTAVAARSWVWSLACAGVILVVCVAIPRGFCGYVCPLGTLIDLFDWSLGRRLTRFRIADDGWWVHIKYFLLLGCLFCALGGVLVTGYVAAIPVITRGFLFLFEPLQSGVLRGWHLVPSFNAGHVVSLVLFFGVLGLGLLKPRFWCKYVCPSGAVFSIGNLFRASERKVESSCIHCNKCVEVCPFDAIKPDFTTRVSDCTLCQTCGGVCPTHAIKFVDRGNHVELKVVNDPPTHETPLGRRGFLSTAAGIGGALVGATGLAAVSKAFGAQIGELGATVPVRPPGSVPEPEFLQLCIRCGECFKACPNNVLQPLAFQQGLEGLWTPQVVADWAGCESSCNACGQVCPTGAIRALPLEEKKAARMGLAIVNELTCLPLANREACQLCVDECDAAGYHAIEFARVHTQADEAGNPVDGTGYLAPVVVADRCVGCGLCQTRCYGINVQQRSVLVKSAIVIEAGDGKEDRMMNGSYAELRRNESQDRSRAAGESDYYVPGAGNSNEETARLVDSDPFGLHDNSAPDDSSP